MGIERISRTTVPRTQVHEWAHYQSLLRGDLELERLLGQRLKTWVEDKSLSNPLAIRWVYLVWNAQLHYIRNDLDSWLNGPTTRDALAKMLAELGDYSCPGHAEQSIESLRCEAATFRVLRSAFPAIERLDSDGDWGTNGRRISVKSVLPLELTYRIAEYALRAWQTIEENVHARRIGRIGLLRLGATDYVSRARIIAFIDRCLEEVVEQWLGQGRRDGEIPNECRFAQMTTGQLYVAVVDPADNSRHIAEMTLEKKTDASDLVSVSCDKNTWYYEPISGAWLTRRLTDALDKIREEHERGRHPIEGWVNLFIHPRNAKAVWDNIDGIKSVVSDAMKEYEFPCSFCLFPEWSYVLTLPIVWSFRGAIGEELPGQIKL